MAVGERRWQRPECRCRGLRRARNSRPACAQSDTIHPVAFPGELPGGTVTFLFTDIEGSTRLLKQLRDGYARVLSAHHELLGAAFAANGGIVVDTQGDSFFVVFRRAQDAVEAAIAAQRALRAHVWPEGAEVRVRMGIHTGQAEASDGRYHGLAVHRAARVGATAHGGQVLVSHTTRNLLDDEEEDSAGISLLDLGEHRLKDLDRPVRLYQLGGQGLASEFPALRTAGPPPDEPTVPPGAGRRRALRLVAPAVAFVVVVAGAVAVLVTRGGSTSAQAAAVPADSVGVFDAGSGKPIAAAPVRSGPSAVAVGAGFVWVASIDSDSVSQIDPQTNLSVQTIKVGNAPSGIAVGRGFVWVTNSLGRTVSKIDPATGTQVQTITVGNGPLAVAYGEGRVWVANSTDRTVVEIDPRTGKPKAPIPVAAGADGIAVGDGAVWVTSESNGSLSRIDSRTRAVTQPINVGGGASAVAVAGNAVWVTNSLANTVNRIDSATNALTDTIPVDAGPSGVAVSPDGKTVWVSSETAGTLTQIDPIKNAPKRIVTTGNRPQSITMKGDTLYVAVRTSRLAHRGGTLRILAADPFSSIDPSVAYDNSSWSTLNETNDGLVGYKRVGGSDGTRLVPDLATTIPIPTDGGKTYAFQVRRGIHYSNGALVRPADFRRAIERSLAAYGRDGSGAGFYLSGITGASACLKAPARCDLSQAIVTDAASNTVTFHLTRPDPDFLQELALPPAFAVPESTPLDARLPLPATGPYKIAAYDPKRGVRLVRNPRFHEWYEAAQPRGFPDEIVWRFGIPPDAQRRAVERGTADLAIDAGAPNEGRFPPRALLTMLRTRYASQLHLDQSIGTYYIFLNTRLPPFNDVKVRQAVNYAVDRDRMVDLRGGPFVEQPSCQVLPPNVGGYQRFCPYTLRPRADGGYTGPDMAKARQLVAESGTRGDPVTVTGIAGIFAPHGGNYFVAVLRSLGYKARYRSFPDSAYNSTAADSSKHIQAGITAWAHDYPTPGNFLPALVTCKAFIPRSPLNSNRAEFCNHQIDADIARARALEVADPGAASRLWTKVDHAIVMQAPFVFLQNPRQVTLVSRRVGNYQYNPQWGVLYNQLWVR